MLQYIINSPSISIHKMTGIEGPKYDPYSFEEYVVLYNEKDVVPHKITIHLGLDCWVSINNIKIERFRPSYPNLSYKEAVMVFEDLTEIRVDDIDRWHRKLLEKCGGCGSKEFIEWAGYPGESYASCAKCNRVIDYSFNEAAVM